MMTRAEQGEALASCFFVEFPGMTTLTFREVFAVGSENRLVVQGQVNANGKASYVRMPGELAWSNLVLRNGIDTDMSLWNWRNSVITAGVDGQKKDGQIYIVDTEGNQRRTWSVRAAWPCDYVVATMVPDTGEMLAQEIHLAHEGLERVA